MQSAARRYTPHQSVKCICDVARPAHLSLSCTGAQEQLCKSGTLVDILRRLKERGLLPRFVIDEVSQLGFVNMFARWSKDSL